MKKKQVIQGLGVSACLALSSFFYILQHSGHPSSDEALLSIIKNDQRGFERYLSAGGSLEASIDVDGKSYRVGELLVKYERVNLIKYIADKKIDFGTNDDMWSVAVSKNNPELLLALMKSQPNYKLNSKTYGPDGRNLLHLASAQCSFKVIAPLHKSGMNWSDKDKKGVTPLTLAADSDCLQGLSYWKEHGADFKAKNGREQTVLAILTNKKDAALKVFAAALSEKRAPTSVVVASALAAPNFYKKRVIPKDNLADRAHLIGPEDRPEEAYESAENSEFSD